MQIMRFHTTIKSRFQELRGMLVLQIDRAEVSGSLTIGERQSYFQGRMLRKNRYAAALRLKTEIYEEDCDMLLRVRDGASVHGSIIGEWEGWSLEGAAAGEPAEKNM